MSGFDIIYSLQDAEFDATQSLYSMPSHWGGDNSLKMARVFHFFSSVFLWTAYFFGDFHWLYLIGVILFNSMLVYQQSIVKPNDLSKVNLAFMTANGIASIVFSIFVITGIILSI